MKTACPRCGANVVFIPSTQKCFCEYCGSEIDIEEFHVDSYDKTNADYNECTCSSCGATLIVDENTTITRCAYCGSNQIITNRFTGEFNPERIIPFKIDNKKFVSIYRKFIRKKILAPNAFRRNTTITEIKGMYVPFYVFKLKNHTYARGVAYKKVKDATYYKYFETEFEMDIRSPQDASILLDDDIMTSLEPFDFSEEKDFNPVYLNGFSAENGNEDTKELLEKAKLRGAYESKRKISKKLEGYKYDKGTMEIRQKENDRKYTLLPVWFFNTMYKNKQYSYALNGQTGKVVGKIPLSMIKFGLVMLILIILGLFITFAGSGNDDNDGIGIVWACIIAFYCFVMKRYRNVTPMLDNPLQRLIDNDKFFIKYSKREFSKKFGKQEFEKRDFRIIDEDDMNMKSELIDEKTLKIIKEGHFKD